MEQIYEALAPVEQQLGRRVNPILNTAAEFHRRRKNGNPFLTKVLVGDTILLIGNDDDLLAVCSPRLRRLTQG
ncbi:hypothetical protein [Acidiferrobacter sp.]|uniref:hypothetical protein n=1 Tax=Acidiferrobacter sp. TaxID=1872107 RepID=UPI0026113A47|nr:hypothetical protein [Acidiferrobacter sp.]